MDTLTLLEQAVLKKLLSGESERNRILQKQICAMRVKERKMTGVGFFTRFSMPDDVPKLPDEASFQIDDVSADINGISHGAGFLLFVKQGAIYKLEGYTYDEPWPQNVHSFHLYYDGTSERK
ncbi:MAG: hypothetical protein ACRECP_00045 [Methylocella sp.]